MNNQMRERVWEWHLPDGLMVRASFDAERDIESVWVGERLVARGRAGRRPEGHLVSAGAYQAVAVRVRFDSADRCTLYRGWDVVAPNVSTVDAARRRTRWKLIGVMSGVMVALSIAAGVILSLQASEPAPRGGAPVAVNQSSSPKARATASPTQAPIPQRPPARIADQPGPRAVKPKAIQFVSAPAPTTKPTQSPPPTAGTQRRARAVF